MGNKQSPPPQNYTGAAEKQGAASQANVNTQTQANRPDVTTPFGSQKWTQGPDGSWQMSSEMSPEVKAAYDKMQGFDWNQFGELDDGSAVRDQATTAAYNQATSRLNPEWDRREASSRTRLANQGLDPNSQAARTQTAQVGQQRNDAYGSAMNSAIREGNVAGSAAFRDNMMARQQAIAEALRNRGLALEDLRGLQGFMATPDFKGAGQADAAPYFNASMAEGENDWRRRMYEDQANADAWRGGFDALKGGYNMFKPFSF